MPIFRAVQLNTFDSERVHIRHSSQRLPGNVPYLIDNLWEFARPQGKPSRRYAVYASPTVELALAGAHPGRPSPNQYLACRVVFRNEPQIFQLSVPDARHHPDVKRLQRLVHDRMTNWGERDLGSKLNLAPLFMPGTTRDELRAAMENNLDLWNIVEEAAAAVTIWRDVPDPLLGELIFELDEENAYTLQPV